MKEYCVFYFPQDNECKVKDFDSSSAMRIFLQQNVENKMIPYIGFIGGNMKMLYTYDKYTDKELVEKMTDYLVEEQRKNISAKGK